MQTKVDYNINVDIETILGTYIKRQTWEKDVAFKI